MRLHLLLGFLAGLALADTQFDICEFSDATPEFYYEYGIDECSPKFSLAPNGVDCQDERQFLEGALTLGITGGYHGNSGVAQSYKITKSLPKDTCGYWTFIPYVSTACGTYTQAPIVGACCEPDLPWQTNGNACIDQAIGLDDKYFWNARTIRGDSVLVYVDCKTLLPLPNENQEWSYRQDGVKLPRHYHDAYVDLWNAQLGDKNAHIVEANDVKCDSKPQADTSDCADAISMLLSDPGKDINYDESLVTSGNCAISIEVGSNWADAPCLGTYLDAAVAAQTIFDECTLVNGGVVGGSLSMGGKAGCYKVKFGKA